MPPCRRSRPRQAPPQAGRSAGQNTAKEMRLQCPYQRRLQRPTSRPCVPEAHGAPNRPGTQSRPLHSLRGLRVARPSAPSRVRGVPLSLPTGRRRSTPATAAPITSTPPLANPNWSCLSRRSGVSRRGGGWRLERTCVVCLMCVLLRERRLAHADRRWKVRPLNNTPTQSKFGVR